jgi:hypothetical protein
VCSLNGSFISLVGARTAAIASTRAEVAKERADLQREIEQATTEAVGLRAKIAQFEANAAMQARYV